MSGRLLFHLVWWFFILCLCFAAVGLVGGFLVWLCWNVIGPGTLVSFDILVVCGLVGAIIGVAIMAFVEVKSLRIAREKGVSFFDAYDAVVEYSLDVQEGFKEWDAARFRDELQLAKNKARAANAILRS